MWSATEHEAEWDCLIGGHNKIEGTEDAHVEFEIQTVVGTFYGALLCGCVRCLAHCTDSVSNRLTLARRLNCRPILKM